MSNHLRKFLRIQWVLLPILLLSANVAWSQCNNPSPFGTAIAPTNNIPLTITTCAFAGEYSTINSCTAGSTYLFSASGGSGNYITIRQGTPGGTVLGFGFSPISVVCTVSGPLYLHYNTNAACGVDGSCHTGVVQCTSCSGGGGSDPCTSISTLSCAAPVTATLAGAGLWNTTSCGFATPGQEKVYSFTPTTTGVHSLQVNSTSNTAWVDYFYKAASGGCNATGWTCILDIFSGPTTATIGTLTAGTTYYILLDPESTVSVTHTFQIVCPAGFDPCASIPTMVCATPVTASSTGTGVWSPGTCGFTTPGQEKVYSFTPTVTGMHTLVITATNSVFVDYFYKVASGGCNATGWTCIGDAFSPESNVFGPLTAGTTYYILYDPESTAAATQTFRIDCPAAGSAPPCVASPTFPVNNSNICPNSNVTLSWPASPGATSYDVYFGTTAVPAFVGNTLATTFNVGVQTTGQRWWEIRPRNAFGPAPGCAIWTFNLVDATAPAITCPASVVANNSPATACSAVVTYGAISATDNCAAPSITLIGGLPSGSVFPVGVTVVTYRAMDPSGNSTTCTFTVTVNDVTLPNITCPANIVRNNDVGLCSAVVTYPTPTATDNCSVASVTLLGGLPSGSVFPVGVTTNTWRATDPSGNTRTCSFTVTVVDNEKPTLTCPANITTGNDWNKCSRAIPYLGSTFIADNCLLGSLVNNSPGTFPIGTTIVKYTLSDNAGNTRTCEMTVTIEDIQPPTVNCPSNVNVFTDLGDCVATLNYSFTASDNCPGYTVEYSQDSPASFDIGLTNVTATITDAAGLTNECVFQINVKQRIEICNGFDDDCDGLTDETEDWHPVAKRYASDGNAQDFYGLSVDIDGDWAIVGSNHKDVLGQNIGSAYLLYRNDDGAIYWMETTKILPPGVDDGDLFGSSVAISNGTAVVGASQDDDGAGNAGAAYVFYQNNSNPNQWDLVKKIRASDPSPSANFGNSMSLDGDLLVVGAYLDDEKGNNAGAAYVFGRNQGGANNWGQIGKLTANDGGADDHFGTSVSMDGTRAMVGSTGDDDKGAEAGAAYVFEQNNGGANAWGQEGKLLASQGTAGDNAGVSVGLSGNRAIVGADQNDLKGSNAGAAFAFVLSGNSWLQEGIILENNGASEDRFGRSVAVDGDYAAIGSPGDDPLGQNSGRAFAFIHLSSAWAQIGILSDGGGKSNDGLGTNLAISGRSIIAGIPNDVVNVNPQQGSIMIFEGLCAGVTPRGEMEDVTTNQAFDVRCYPVPFKDELTVEVNAHVADVRITCTNALGQLVTTLFEGALEGEGIFHWKTVNMQPGVYFLRVQAGDQVQTKAVLLAR